METNNNNNDISKDNLIRTVEDEIGYLTNKQLIDMRSNSRKNMLLVQSIYKSLKYKNNNTR